MKGNKVNRPELLLVFERKNAKKKKKIYLCDNFREIYVIFAGLIVRKMHLNSYQFY